MDYKRKVPGLLLTVLIDQLLGNVVVVMSLEYRCLVLGSSSNSIEIAHDVSEHVERVEDVNADSTIETSGLQQPQVLLVVHAVAELVLAFNTFLSLDLEFLHLLVNNVGG